MSKEQDLFSVYDYDGWHVDQLGDQGTVYDDYGNAVDLTSGFALMLQQAKTILNKRLVMNAVTNYGQPQIATTPVDFLYTEVWPPYVTYNGLVDVINADQALGNNQQATVLAAYMDQDFSDTVGTFNTPAGPLTEACIFANGGDHIELGEHMLDNPYYPNNELSMSCYLQQMMIKYYDFITAYENILRDSITASPVALTTTGNNLLADSAVMGSIWYMSKQRGPNTQIFHFINLVSATTLDWNDPNGNQPQPANILNVPLSFTSDSIVAKIYFMSPDWNNGNPLPVAFTQSGNTYSCSLPYLTIWSTLLVEYARPVVPPLAIKDVAQNISVQVFPNPFEGQVNFNIQVPETGSAGISITNQLGDVVYTRQINVPANARDIVTVPFQNLSSGMYFWRLDIVGNNGQDIAEQTGKLVHF